MTKIFIVAPQFPPSAMPPAQRERLLVRHLVEFGLYPTVFTVDHYYREELADPWMTELAGNNFETITVKCFDQRKTRKLGIGDLSLRMLPFLYIVLKRNAKKQKPAFILYPVPPWYIMIIAPFIKWSTGIPYGIDFIDPWVSAEKKKNSKGRLSQWVARRFEGFAVKRASIIFAVSQGILNDLVSRYPQVKNIPLVPVAYGVEINDFKAVSTDINAGKDWIMIRYIGALSDSMLTVTKELLTALKKLQQQQKLAVEFIGTSYAGAGIATSRIGHIIDETETTNFVTEKPDRVSYSDALKLTGNADVLLLIGDMTIYYAASKLMGLIASQKPFFAFLHKESFPAKFLRECNYPYVVEYTEQAGELPEDKISEVVNCLTNLCNNIHVFMPVSISNPLFQQHTANAMTAVFAENIKNVMHE